MVAAVRRGDHVGYSKAVADSDSHCFLTDRQVQRTGHVARLELLVHGLLEASAE
jgi:hypothetical protein